MKNKNEPKEQLINELAGLRQRIAQLEKLGTEYEKAEKAKEKGRGVDLVLYCL